MANVHMFPDAHQLLITGGNFSQIQQVFHSSGGRDVGLNILRQYIAADAMYDAAERFPPPKCHAGTREKIIKTIMDWINDADAEEQALWLYGSAGAGKSAIAQSIAMLLQDVAQDGKYAAGFFFTKGALGRGDTNKLFSTIAYQLAINFPSFRAVLDAAVLKDPTLPTKTIYVQLQHLIIEPLRLVEDWPLHHPTVIIDGLDECSGSKRIQSALLTLLSDAIIEHHIPLRFLIVSRPEYWIADCFECGCFLSIARILSLRDDADADAGIEKYLRDEFNRIYEENSLVMSSVPRPWPPDNIIKRFVNSASGQFIYASIVIKFVGDSSDFSDPRSQLHILQEPGPYYASAFSELDKLYATILSVYPKLESMKRVLGAILCDFDQCIIQEYLGVDSGEYHLVLRAISSLIYKKTHNYPDVYRALEPTFSPLVFMEGAITFCHLSFVEFLHDESRSGRYAIDIQQVEIEVHSAIISQGCGMLQDHQGIEKALPRVSEYLFMLKKVTSKGLPMGAVIDSMKHLESTLQTVLSQDPVQIPHAAHALWFADKISKFYRRILSEMLKESRKTFNVHKAQFEFLGYALNKVMIISTGNLLKTVPTTTPVFAYLVSHTETLRGTSHQIEDIRRATYASTDDLISDLQQLQGIINVHCYKGLVCVYVVRLMFTQEVYKVLPRHQTLLWDASRLLSVAGSIAKILDESKSDNQALNNAKEYNDIYSFMKCKRLSDIHSKNDLEDANRIKVLKLMLQPRFFEKIKSLNSVDFAVTMLLWLDRQLTGTIKAVIAEHEDNLLQAMQFTARHIFQHIYLPEFTNIYSTSLIMLYYEHNTDFDVHLCVSARSDGTCSVDEENRPVTNTIRPFPYTGTWGLDDIVPKAVYTFNIAMMKGQASGVISPSDWYPHLAAFLLTALVRSQYGKLRRELEKPWAFVSRKFFVPLIECMPYAIPTQNNLDSIRALQYLWTRIERKQRWRPPFGFCSLTIDFLKKYDESSLSSLEFARLRKWLLELRTHESKRILMNEIDEEYEWKFGEDGDDYTTDEDS